MERNARAKGALRRFPVIAKLALTLAFVVISVGAVAIGVLYDAGLEEKKRSLISIAADAAALIDTAVNIESQQEFYSFDGVRELSAVTIAKNAFGQLSGVGKSGAVLIAQRNGEDLRILYQKDFENAVHSDFHGQIDHGKISATSGYGKAIIAALHGQTGAMLAVHESKRIITAYAPIRSQGLALVAEAHMDEFNAPFITAVVHSVIFGFILTVIGVYLIYRQTIPVVVRAQESESRFRGFADTATEWFWETGPNLRFRTMGKGGRMDGDQNRDHYLGLTRQDLTIEDTNSPKWQAHLNDLNAHRPFENFQYEGNLSGEIRTLSVTGIPVFGERGEFKGYQGTGRDITDLVKDKRRIEEAEERLRRAFETITMAVILIDEHGKIEGFNPHASKVFGYKAKEVMGKNVAILMPEPDRSRHDTYIRNYVHGGPASVIGIGREVTGLRKNGEEFPMHLGVGEMMLRGQRHFVGSINDLSESKTMEQQLRRSQKMDAIGQLTGGIAHDFNNLLGIIIGNLDLVQGKLDPEDKNFQRIERSIKAAERGANLTGRLLRFSRQSPEENDTVNVNETLLELRELVQRSITSEVEIELLLDETISPARINKSDFEDALINLSINARDAMPNGGVLTIETKTSRVDQYSNPTVQQVPIGDYIEIAVSDNGSGMSKEVIDHIFEPFFTTKTEGKGTGLGMAMVYGFVKRSNGAISIYSELGVGTTIKLYLPLAGDDGLGSTRKDDGTRSRKIRGGNESILIVDDERELAEVAQTILTELGYSTVVAYDGSQALEKLSSGQHFDLLLTDVIMPGTNGYELANRAAEMRPDLKILLTSGYTGNTSMKNLDTGKKYPLLRKPYSNRDVALQVRRILDTPQITEPPTALESSPND
ncbi:MAG: PAS domain S-box protein [Rhodospirillales bacterium]|nr:PAS domain S-box protein [Rhodospirillales bacterium]